MAYRGGRVASPGCEQAPRAIDAASAAQDRGPVELTIAERGILDNLRVEPMTAARPGPGEVEIEVRRVRA